MDSPPKWPAYSGKVRPEDKARFEDLEWQNDEERGVADPPEPTVDHERVARELARKRQEKRDSRPYGLAPRTSAHLGINPLYGNGGRQVQGGGQMETPIPTPPVNMSSKDVLQQIAEQNEALPSPSSATARRGVAHQRAAQPSAEVNYGREQAWRKSLTDQETIKEQSKNFSMSGPVTKNPTIANQNAIRRATQQGTSVHDYSYSHVTKVVEEVKDAVQSNVPKARSETSHQKSQVRSDKQAFQKPHGSQGKENKPASRRRRSPIRPRKAGATGGVATLLNKVNHSRVVRHLRPVSGLRGGSVPSTEASQSQRSPTSESNFSSSGSSDLSKPNKRNTSSSPEALPIDSAAISRNARNPHNIRLRSTLLENEEPSHDQFRQPSPRPLLTRVYNPSRQRRILEDSSNRGD